MCFLFFSFVVDKKKKSLPQQTSSLILGVIWIFSIVKKQESNTVEKIFGDIR